MNGKIEALELFLLEKEKVLMDKCMQSPFIISENDVLAKHYSLIDAEIEKVEYKIDDEPGTYGKGHQPTDFKKDVIRLSRHSDYIQRAFALYYYRGPIKFAGNVFDKKASNYLFQDSHEISNKEKLNVFFVDKRGVHKLDLF